MHTRKISAPLMPAASQSNVAIVTTTAGTQVAVMPIHEYRRLESEIQNLKTNRSGWLVLASCGGALFFTASLALVAWIARASGVQPPAPPIVVEKPVVVDRNCFAWCK